MAKNYYVSVYKKTLKPCGSAAILVHTKKSNIIKNPDRFVVSIPIEALNAFIQRYIPYPPVDQIPGN